MSSVQKDGQDKDSRVHVRPPPDKLCPEEHALTPSHASLVTRSARPAKDEARHSTKLPTASHGWTPSTWERSSAAGTPRRSRLPSGSPTRSRQRSRSYSRVCSGTGLPSRDQVIEAGDEPSAVQLDRPAGRLLNFWRDLIDDQAGELGVHGQGEDRRVGLILDFGDR